MNFNLIVEKSSVNWNEKEIENKLIQLGEAKKDRVWIKKDLSCEQSHWIGRFFWTIVAKFFSWARKTFYQVDLQESQSILNQLQVQINIAKNQKLTELFIKAAKNFNAIAPNHQVTIGEGDDKEIEILATPEKENSPSLEGSLKELWSLSMDFSKNAKRALSLAGCCLVDLASTPNFEASSRSPSDIQDELLLQTAKHYPLANDKNLKQLKTALPLILVKGLYSEDSPIREDAESVLKELIAAYFNNVVYTPHHLQFKEMLLSLTASYYRSIKDEQLREKAIMDLWDPAGTRKKSFLLELAQHPWNIKPQTPALKRAMSLKSPKMHRGLKHSKSWHYAKTFKFKKGKAPFQAILEEAVQKEMPGIAKFAASFVEPAELDSSLKKLEHSEEAGSKKLAGWIGEMHKSPQKLAPSDLKHYAETLGYGYKAANLMVLEDLSSEISKATENCTVKVPPFLPISDVEVQSELSDFLPPIRKLWDQFLNTFDKQLKKQFLEAKSGKEAAKVPLKISEEGEKILARIKEEYDLYFQKHIFYSIQTEEWLAVNKPDFVIVRSTGKEDSDENSNAGGNESIPYVKPTIEAISQAAGEVLASYFGKKSVMQRLIVGDRSLFNDPPFMPVLIQTMVVENIGGVGSKEEDVPRCGVMFTQQQGKKAGSTLVQAGLGNNEGVVSSQVSVDTYLLDDEVSPYKVVREKKTRFVSKQVSFEPDEYKLFPIKNNNPSLERGQAISDPLLQDMKKVANFISETYGTSGQKRKPMDVEYTIKIHEKGEEKPVLYLLQARPLMDIKKTDPSFIQLDAFKNPERINACALLDGGSEAKKIDHPDQVIVVNDLPEALKAYMENKNPENIRAIMIRKMAPSTSHEAVMLRPTGVPVFVMEDLKDYAEAANWIKGAKKEPVFLDPQRGFALKGEVLNQAQAIKEGWITYPIPMELTIDCEESLTSAKIEKESIQEKKQQFLQLHQAISSELQKAPLTKIDMKNEGAVKGLLETLCIGGEEEAMNSISSLLANLTISLDLALYPNDQLAAEKEHFSGALDADSLKILLFATLLLQTLQNEVIPAIKKSSPQTLERLYAVKKLEIMLLQEPKDHVLGSHSFKSLLIEGETLVESLKDYDQKFHFKLQGDQVLKILDLIKVKHSAFSKSAESVWNQFVIKLNNMEAAAANSKAPGNMTLKHSPIDEIWRIVKRMEKLDLLPVWLNLVFISLSQKSGSSPDGAFELDLIEEISEMLNKEGETLEWVEENLDELSILEQQVSNWQDPAFVKKMTKKLKSKFREQFGFSETDAPGALHKKYQEAGQLGRIALLQFMGKAVDLYDRMIKAEKGSKSYTSQKDQISDLAELLEGYFSMLVSAMRIIPPQDEAAIMKPAMGKALSFEQYLKNLAEGTKYTIGGLEHHSSPGFNKLKQDILTGQAVDTNLLLGSSQFAVDALVIGSKADMLYSVHWPKTLEDYFTTFHQNLEKIRKRQMTTCGFGCDILEGNLKTFAKEIEKGFNVELSHLEMQKGGIEAVFQIPLRFHSAKLSLSTNASQEGAITLEAEVFGHNAFERWDQTASLIAFLAEIEGITLADGELPKIDYQNTHGVKFKLKISPEYKNTKELTELLIFVIKTMSMEEISFEGKKGYAALLGKMASLDLAPAFESLSRDFYKGALWASAPLMKRFSEANDPTALLKAASGTLLGLASYGLTEYARSGGQHGGGIQGQGLENYFSKTKYAFVKDNVVSNNRSLHLIAVLHLIRLMEEGQKEAINEIDMLIGSPLIKEKLPWVQSALIQAKILQLPKEQQLERLLDEGSYFEALSFALENDLKDKLGDLAKRLNEKDEKTRLNFAKSIAATCYFGKHKKAVKDLAGKLSLSKKEKLPWSSKDRRACRQKLEENVLSLQQLAGKDFEKNLEKIVELSVKSLIGLSQSRTWENLTFEKFEGLWGVLGNPKYNYCQPTPLKMSTGLLKTAAPLYIVKVLQEQKIPEKKIVKHLDRLFSDYLAYGRFGAHREGYETALLGIAKSYYESSKDKPVAKSKIKEWASEEKSFLDHLKNAPYNLDLGN